MTILEFLVWKETRKKLTDREKSVLEWCRNRDNKTYLDLKQKYENEL